jgi:hypothetical protein
MAYLLPLNGYSFLQPTAGATFYPGSTMSIVWDPPVDINDAPYWLAYDDNAEIELVFPFNVSGLLPPDTTDYVWEIPLTLLPGPYELGVVIATQSVVSSFTYLSDSFFSNAMCVSLVFREADVVASPSDSSSTSIRGSSSTTGSEPATSTVFQSATLPVTSTNGGSVAILTISDATLTVLPGQTAPTTVTYLSTTTFGSTASSTSSSGLTTDGRVALIAGLAVGVPAVLLAGITVWLMVRRDSRNVLKDIRRLLRERL